MRTELYRRARYKPDTRQERDESDESHSTDERQGSHQCNGCTSVE